MFFIEMPWASEYGPRDPERDAEIVAEVELAFRMDYYRWVAEQAAAVAWQRGWDIYFRRKVNKEIDESKAEKDKSEGSCIP
jgi:hypothetical protein